MNREKRKQFIMNDLASKLKWLEDNTEHNVIYIALQGSQNYDMDIYTDDYTSDIDAKAIILPSFDDILKGRNFFSHTYIMEDNSHIDVKDIRLYIDLWKKANPAYLEILFTEFYIMNNTKFKQILDLADAIAKANISRLFSCIKGMQMEKYKALKHPYPTVRDKIDKYGYDPKQYHHIIRLYYFIRDLCEYNFNFKEALVINNTVDKELCLNAKIHPCRLAVAESTAVTFMESADYIINNYRLLQEPFVDSETYAELEIIIYDIIKEECRKNLV